MQRSAGGYAAESTGELKRGGGNRALSDAGGDALAGVPLLVEVLHLPGGGGHGSGDLIRQVDTGALGKAQRGGVAGDGIDAQLIGEGIEVGVARPGDGVMDVNHAVMLVARKKVAVERCPAIAHDAHGLGLILLTPSPGHDDLESASRW